MSDEEQLQTDQSRVELRYRWKGNYVQDEEERHQIWHHSRCPRRHEILQRSARHHARP